MASIFAGIIPEINIVSVVFIAAETAFIEPMPKFLFCLYPACVAAIIYYLRYVTLIFSPVNGAVSIVITAPEIV